MRSPKRRPFKFLAFFLVLCVLCLGVYREAKGPTIQADEVRVFRSSSSKNARPIVQFKGDEAQDAASHFNFSTTGNYYECLDSEGWFRIVFDYKGKEQTFDVYLHNGQMEPSDGNIDHTKHLSESSRRYWEQLLKRKG